MKIDLPLDGTLRDRLRPLSKAIFKSEYALEIFLVMASADRFYASEFAALVPGCQGSFVNETIRRLCGAGLIKPLAKEPGQQRNYYRRVSSPFWDLVTVWARALIDSASHNVAQLPPRGG